MRFIQAHDHDTGWDKNRVFEIFPSLGDYRLCKGGLLNGGEQKMIAIDRALMTDPGLLLLDEPTERLALMTFLNTLLINRTSHRAHRGPSAAVY